MVPQNSYRDSRLYIPTLVGKDPILSLCDGGASTSCADSHLFNRFQELGFPTKKARLSVRAANNSNMKVIGISTIQVQIGKKSFSIDVLLVEKLAVQLIIGDDALKAMKARVDYGTSKITIQDEKGSEVVDLIKLASLDSIHNISYINVAPVILPDGKIVGLQEQPSGEHVDFEKAKANWGEVDYGSGFLPEIEHPDLSMEQKEKCWKLLQKHQAKFADSPGLLKDYEAEIYISEGQPPIRSKPYRMTLAEAEFVSVETNKLIKEGKLEPATGIWSSPCFVVNKPDSTDKRLVVNYQKLNNVSVRVSGGTPRVETVIQSLQGSKWRSRIDLKSSFHQIKLSEKAREYMSIILPTGNCLRPVCLLQGYVNSLQIFSSALRQALAPVIAKGIVVLYVDDLYVHSRGTFEDHLRDLDEILDLLRAKDLQINWKKLQIAVPKLKVLGHIIEGNTIRPCKSKISSILNFRTPRNVKDIRSLLGSINFYRKYIEGASFLVKPISHLTKKNVKFKWGEEQEKALAEIRRILATEPVLTLPELNGRYRVEVDSSLEGVGAVLYGENEKGEILGVVEYYSYRFTPTERTQHASARECLGLIKALDQFSQYIKGTDEPIKVITDSTPIIWLYNSEHTQSKLNRFRYRLSEYNLKIQHIPGASHHVPDWLSRSTPGDPVEVCEEVKVAEISSVLVDNMRETMDPWYCNLRDCIVKKQESYQNFRVKNNLIYKVVKISNQSEETFAVVVPTDCRYDLMSQFHDTIYAAHKGARRTAFNIIQAGYFWPNMKRDVRKFVVSCDKCQRSKASNSARLGTMRIRPANLSAFSLLYIDIVGPMVRSKCGNYKYILTVMDDATRYVIAKPLRNATAKEVVKVLQQDVSLIYGFPEVVVSDNASIFLSQVYDEFLEEIGAKKHLVPLYSPSRNAVERVHKSLKASLRALCTSHDQWAELLPYVIQSLNNTVHSTLNVAPTQLVFGRCVRTPFTVPSGVCSGECLPTDPEAELEGLTAKMKNRWKLVKEAVRKGRTTQANRYNLRRKAVLFKVNDLVYCKSFPKSSAIDKFSKSLAFKYVGPFKISRVVSPTQYELADLNNRIVGTHSIEHLKLFIPREPT